MINNILNYWYKLEYFTPCWPVDMKRDIDLIHKVDLPWSQEQKNKKVKLAYDLYFGPIKSIKLIKWMLSEVKEKEEERIEPDNSNTCMFAFKVDEKGYYVSNSFAISGFVWGICKIVSEGSFKAKLNPKDVELLESTIDKWIINSVGDNKEPINREIIKEIFIDVTNVLHLPSEFSNLSLWARKKIYHMKKDGSFPDIEPTTELFQSFYLKDIKKVIENPNPRVSKYILAKNQQEDEKLRISIDSDIDEMKKSLAADNFPLGVWPGKFNPSLMQQIGINICTHGKEEIFSINGPPGTGKTTLLKEIVASNIIERAKLLIEYDKPDKAFVKKEFKNPSDDYNCSYYRMDKRLKKYGIIVASNNNAAVENISMELPKYIGKDRTGRFSKTDCIDSEDVYFTDVARELIGEPAWGLVSAKLGKKENLKKLKERLWWAKDGITLRRYLYEETCDWDSAHNNFQIALKNVLEKRKEIENIQAELSKLIVYKQSLREKMDSLSLNITRNLQFLEDLKSKQSEAFKKLENEKNKLNQLSESKENIKTAIEQLYSGSSLFQRLRLKLSHEYKHFKRKEKNITLQISIQKNIVFQLENDYKKVQSELNDCLVVLDRDSKILNDINKEYRLNTPKNNATKILKYDTQLIKNINQGIEPASNTFKELFDGSFWDNITKNEKSQESCPWVYDEYNKLREELFYQALQVNKAFILSSKSVKVNLQRLFSLWDGKCSIEDSKNSYGDLLNTLLLVIPVISTTFASVETFLSDIQQDELGLLIVDEAGQATPQSALGALWRCKRAIIVGDPLQVEPVLTVPKELIKCFADEYNIPEGYRIPEISVQMLADEANKYGGYRDVNGEKKWLGCPLVVHRRCLNPMFDISNEVAYDGKMFIKSNPPKEGTIFALESSAWFDVKGRENGNKDHTVKSQVDFTKNMFKRFIETYKGFPELYIITPFKLVAHNLREMMKSVLQQYEYIEKERVETWVSEHCGTVHTFQGKEAHEVILVLGCDKQSGKGAAQWVGQKPNIINVAVSRAQFRIAVIGDYDLWKEVPNVQVVCRHLEVKKEDVVKNDLL